MNEVINEKRRESLRASGQLLSGVMVAVVATGFTQSTAVKEPAGFNSNRKYAAILVTHPFAGGSYAPCKSATELRVKAVAAVSTFSLCEARRVTATSGADALPAANWSPRSFNCWALRHTPAPIGSAPFFLPAMPFTTCPVPFAKNPSLPADGRCIMQVGIKGVPEWN